MRHHIALDPPSKCAIARERSPKVQIGRRQYGIFRPPERGRHPLIFRLGKLRWAVLDWLPLTLHFDGKGLDTQRLDQDFNARFVLVVAPTMAVVDAQDSLDVRQAILPGQTFTQLLGNDGRAA